MKNYTNFQLRQLTVLYDVLVLLEDYSFLWMILAAFCAWQAGAYIQIGEFLKGALSIGVVCLVGATAKGISHLRRKHEGYFKVLEKESERQREELGPW